MDIWLIKRKKIVHAGLHIISSSFGESTIISACSKKWFCFDEQQIGNSAEVTCKRCQKYVKEAEENDGYINLKPKRKRR